MPDQTREVGIIIKAVDQASGVMRTMGETGSRVFVGLRAGINKTREAFKSTGVAAALLNQALGLSRQAVETFRRVFVDTAVVALEFREKSDILSKGFENMRHEVKLTQARIGDIFLPVLVAFGNTMTKNTGKISDWFRANRQLIGTKLIEFITGAANAALNVLTPALIVVSRIILGWRLIFESVKGAFNELFAAMSKGLSMVLSGPVAKVISVFDLEMGQAIANASKAVDELGDIFDESGDEAFAECERLIGQQERLEASIKNVSKAIKSGIGQFGAEAFKLLGQTAAGAKEIISDEKPIKNLQQVTRAISESSDQQAEAKQKWASLGVVAASVTKTIGDEWAQVALGAQTAGAAARNSALTVTETTILAAAASAAAKQFDAHAFLPFIGITVGAAAAASIFGLIRGLLNKMPAAQFGGLVQGGTPGADSIGVLVRNNEGILQSGQTAAIIRLGDALDRLERRGFQAERDVGGRDGGPTIVANFNSVGPIVSAEASRAVKTLRKLDRKHSLRSRLS